MTLHFKINKRIELVFDYLSNMQKFASVHPVISKIVNTGENTYLVYETLKIGFFPFSFTYPVSLNYNSIEKTVVIKATVFKITKIEMHYRLSTQNDFTIIDEEIIFESPLPIKKIMGKIFSKQHALLFRNIEAIRKD